VNAGAMVSRERRAWRRNHLFEASMQVRAVASDLRRDRAEAAKASSPDLFRRNSVGGHRRSTFSPGLRLGTLSLLRDVGRTAYGASVWIATCDCGSTCRLVPSALTRAIRTGYEATCPICREAQREQLTDLRRELVADAFRRQYVDYGTLWTQTQSLALAEAVREDLEAEFGPVTGERLRLSDATVDEGVRFGVDASRRAFAERAMKSWLGGARVESVEDALGEWAPTAPIELTDDERFALSQVGS